MMCPKCGYAMSDFDIECPRCKRLEQQAQQQAAVPPPPPPPHEQPATIYPPVKSKAQPSQILPWAIVLAVGIGIHFIVENTSTRVRDTTTVEGTSSESAARSWEVAASWSGEGIKTTEAFTVGGEWAIEWNTRPGRYGNMNFQIYTHRADGALSDVDANIIGAGQDISYKHRAGSYYLMVNSGQPWTVVIWDKR